MNYLKVDTSAGIKEKKFYFSDGSNNTTTNYTLKQIMLIVEHYRQLKMPYENKSGINFLNYNTFK